MAGTVPARAFDPSVFCLPFALPTTTLAPAGTAARLYPRNALIAGTAPAPAPVDAAATAGEDDAGGLTVPASSWREISVDELFAGGSGVTVDTMGIAGGVGSGSSLGSRARTLPASKFTDGYTSNVSEANAGAGMTSLMRSVSLGDGGGSAASAVRRVPDSSAVARDINMLMSAPGLVAGACAPGAALPPMVTHLPDMASGMTVEGLATLATVAKGGWEGKGGGIPTKDGTAPPLASLTGQPLIDTAAEDAGDSAVWGVPRGAWWLQCPYSLCADPTQVEDDAAAAGDAAHAARAGVGGGGAAGDASTASGGGALRTLSTRGGSGGSGGGLTAGSGAASLLHAPRLDASLAAMAPAPAPPRTTAPAPRPRVTVGYFDDDDDESGGGGDGGASAAGRSSQRAGSRAQAITDQLIALSQGSLALATKQAPTRGAASAPRGAAPAPAPPSPVAAPARSPVRSGDASLDAVDELLDAETTALRPRGSGAAVATAASTAASTARSTWVITRPLSEEELTAAEATFTPVMTWPFKLDRFQREAIVHMETVGSSAAVFVAAHTSAGKTLVAEYAIALSIAHRGRAVYTSPIKALSNQKFHDLREKFGGPDGKGVGIVTGDISLNPDAPCLVMTTEILRSMLYRGDDMIRDIEFAVFDEIHYINDEERGLAYEEVLLLLPDSVGLVFLSATSPNKEEFADWVGRTKRKPVRVVGTTKRPVPLNHFLWADDKLTLMMDGAAVDTGDVTGGWKAVNWRAVQDKLSGKVPPPAAGGAAGAGAGAASGGGRGGGAGGGGGGHGGSGRGGSFRGGRPARGPPSFATAGRSGGGVSRQDKQNWSRMLTAVQKGDLLPAIIFAFSKKKCEECAFNGLSAVDLTSHSEKSAIHMFVGQAVKRLSAIDRALPQIVRLRDLLKRGIGIHHAGLLPIMKETVELLFARGLVKVLFATETFAMGINMPARSVIFNGIRKHDGTAFRNLTAGEYTQMAGRAGRRGLDTRGTVIVMCWGDSLPELGALQSMMMGVPTRLTSQFRLTYNMILNVLRTDVPVTRMMARSFAEASTQRALGGRDIPRLMSAARQQADAIERDIRSLPCVRCDSGGTAAAPHPYDTLLLDVEEAARQPPRRLLANAPGMPSYFETATAARARHLELINTLLHRGRSYADAVLCAGRIVIVDRVEVPIEAAGAAAAGEDAGGEPPADASRTITTALLFNVPCLVLDCQLARSRGGAGVSSGSAAGAGASRPHISLTSTGVVKDGGSGDADVLMTVGAGAGGSADSEPKQLVYSLKLLALLPPASSGPRYALSPPTPVIGEAAGSGPASTSPSASAGLGGGKAAVAGAGAALVKKGGKGDDLDDLMRGTGGKKGGAKGGGGGKGGGLAASAAGSGGGAASEAAIAGPPDRTVPLSLLHGMTLPGGATGAAAAPHHRVVAVLPATSRQLVRVTGVVAGGAGALAPAAVLAAGGSLRALEHNALKLWEVLLASQADVTCVVAPPHVGRPAAISAGGFALAHLRLPPLNPTRDIKPADTSLDAAQAFQDVVDLERLCHRSKCAGCVRFDAEWYLFAALDKVSAHMAALRAKFSVEALALYPEMRQRFALLRRLHYTRSGVETAGGDGDGADAGAITDIVDTRGRVAAEVNTCDELVFTEMVFAGVLEPLSPAECAALLSCLVFKERSGGEEAPFPPVDNAVEEGSDDAGAAAGAGSSAAVDATVHTASGSVMRDALEQVIRAGAGGTTPSAATPGGGGRAAAAAAGAAERRRVIVDADGEDEDDAGGDDGDGNIADGGDDDAALAAAVAAAETPTVTEYGDDDPLMRGSRTPAVGEAPAEVGHEEALATAASGFGAGAAEAALAGYSPIVSIPMTLAAAYMKLRDIAMAVGKLQAAAGLDVEPYAFTNSALNHGLLLPTYAWACGVPFAGVCTLTEVAEGTIVRTISRLDETCREVRNAARIIGDAVLFKKMDVASAAIKRDVIFAASLYLQ